MKKDCDPASDPDCYVTASWEEPADPDGDSLTYNIWFSKNDPEFGDSANQFREENLENSVSVFDLPAEWDGSTVFWKVQAVDGYGAVRESDTRSFEIDNYSNPATGAIRGYVYESDTEPPEPLRRAKVRIVTGDKSVSATTTSRGYYSKKMSPGEYEVHASKTRYKDSEPVEVNVREGKTLRQNFFLEKEDK
ncbi:MAG: carboxypeptidase regulatory-like domain-containing protein [Desulfobacteraceae bacterium]|nr:carboxypeptidase regulatory-like domain-containing protein [Desulfobacteraceae bacterium]